MSIQILRRTRSSRSRSSWVLLAPLTPRRLAAVTPSSDYFICLRTASEILSVLHPHATSIILNLSDIFYRSGYTFGPQVGWQRCIPVCRFDSIARVHPTSRQSALELLASKRAPRFYLGREKAASMSWVAGNGDT